MHLGDYDQAITEAAAGIRLADDCGFGKFSIDLRIALAEALLAAGDARKALQNAREALDRSELPDCGYAWGRADGLHFCGVALFGLGERELARRRLHSRFFQRPMPEPPTKFQRRPQVLVAKRFDLQSSRKLNSAES